MKQCTVCSKLVENDLGQCPYCENQLKQYILYVEGITYYTEQSFSTQKVVFDGYEVTISLSNKEEIRFTVNSLSEWNSIMRWRAKERKQFGIQLYRDAISFNQFSYKFYGQGDPDKTIASIEQYYSLIREYSKQQELISQQQAEEERLEAERVQKEEAIRQERIQSQAEQFRDEIEAIIRNIDRECISVIDNILFNFASEYEQDIFQNHKILAAFLYRECNMGTLILLPDDVSLLARNLYNEPAQDMLVEKYPFLKKYEMLSELIAEYVNINREELLFATYVLLWKAIMGFCSSKWISLNPEYKQCNCGDDAINEYVRIAGEKQNSINVRFVMYMMSSGFIDQSNYLKAYDDIYISIKEKQAYVQRQEFNNKMCSPRNPDFFDNEEISIEDVDLMTGKEFELLVARIFRKLGFVTTITKASGDQGVDIIAVKENMSIGIQAKCYGSHVGNAAIQEVVAGKHYYQLNRAMVVTNNHFTEQSIELAKANEVVLWNRTILKEKLTVLKS